MRINEIFYSIQGEGIHSGLPMTFIRFQFCPFACSYCDTKYGQDRNGGQEMTVEEVVGSLTLKKHWVCITGGEPLSQPKAFSELVRNLSPWHLIEVETSGLLPLPWKWKKEQWLYRAVDSWVVDIKCPSSEVSQYTYWSNLPQLRPRYDQVKFVVGNEEDLRYVSSVISQYPHLPNVLVQPVWGSGMEEQCVEFVKKNGGRFGMQLHKILWGEKKGV